MNFSSDQSDRRTGIFESVPNMAADLEPIVPGVEESSIENQSIVRQEASKPSDYPWQTELHLIITRDRRKINDILERRGAAIRNIYVQSQNSVEDCHLLEREWLALVTEKDKNLRQQIEEENEQAKRNQIKKLYQVLESLGTFTFSRPNEAVLKRNLAKMHHQIAKYCSRNKIDVTVKDSNDTVKSSESPDESIFAPPPPPPQTLIPPPPPPPPLTPLTSIKATPQNDPRNLPRKRGALTTKNNPTTPCDQRNEELLKRIRGGCRSELRRTPFERSPGGTPFKRQRRVSDSDASDLITVALKKKFQNVAFQSPRENDSPRSFTSLEDLQQN